MSKQGKTVGKQARMFVVLLHNYFTREFENDGPLISLNQVQERVATALCISRSTVKRVVRRNECGISQSPKKAERKAPITKNMDNFTRDAIRIVIYDMTAKKEHITLRILLTVLKEKDIFVNSLSSLHRLLIDMGFTYKKDDPRKALIEQNHIRVARIKFLREYKKLREENIYTNFIFLDETWIFSRGSCRKSWQNNDIRSIKKNFSKGTRYVILHAGGKNGFVKNCGLIFSSSNNAEDYHGEMNAESFEKWIKERLLPNLDEPSVIIMDNATYHSRVQNPVPNMSWKKAEIVNYLTQHNIEFENHLLKPELVQIAKKSAPEKKYVVDELIQREGHTVLRLPPYNCQFNAIELVWSQSKRYFDSNIGREGYGHQKVLEMWDEALNTITEENWQNYVKHIDKTVNDWWDREIRVEIEVEPLIINVAEDSDSESDSESESE